MLAYQFGTGLAVAAIIGWVVAWVVGAVSIPRRNDIGVVWKVLWLVALVVLPYQIRYQVQGSH